MRGVWRAMNRLRRSPELRNVRHVPPLPVLTPVPSSPARTISASVYFVSSGLMLPAPPRPWDTSGALILDRVLMGMGSVLFLFSFLWKGVGEHVGMVSDPKTRPGAAHR